LKLCFHVIVFIDELRFDSETLSTCELSVGDFAGRMHAMLMADTMAIFFVILGMMLAFPGLWLLSRGLWPERVTDAAATCSKGLIKPFLVGLPSTVITILAAIVLSNLFGPGGKLAAVGLACFYMVLAHAGIAGFATCIGERLASPADIERPWKATLRGGIVLELSFLLPILGWFVILPVSIIIGCGSALLSLLKFKRRTTATAPSMLSQSTMPPASAAASASDFQIGGPLGMR
jgi:hypothetical protein